ncbi:hypothetical protein ACF0H5_021246 [Mactra antiquata]
MLWAGSRILNMFSHWYCNGIVLVWYSIVWYGMVWYGMPDDTASVFDTIIGLQRQLNCLNDFCKEYKLVVNTDKTKIMVFKNGGQLSRHEHWHYSGKLVK